MNIAKLTLIAFMGALGGILLGWAWHDLSLSGANLGTSIVETAAACGALAAAYDIVSSFLTQD